VVGLARISKLVRISLVRSWFVRISLCFFAAHLILGAFALAQVEAQTAAAATVPRLIRINGTVHDDAGKPLTGNLGLTFTLYQDETSQSAVWQEVQTLPLDSAGHFSALLGATSDSGLPLEIFSAAEARWLGIRADGQTEQPRILLLSVAYALKAADTELLGGKPASAYVLADSQNAAPQLASGTNSAPANSPSAAQILTPGAGGVLLSPTPQTACSGLSSDGTATVNQIAKFTSACNIENSAIFESGGSIGIGNTAPAGTLDVSGAAFVRGALTLPPVNTATATQGYDSNPLVMEASTYNTILSRAVPYIWEWQAEPVGNDSAATSSTLNLLFGVTGDVSETGLSVSQGGIITFASGQTFPGQGTGTVTSVATGAGLTGGPITKSGTISIPSAGVTNSMLANPSVTIAAGSGLSGGGTVALGGTVTLTNASPSSGGTVTSIASGTGLSGGPITGSGTLSLNTSYTNGLYLQLAGGTLTGALSGTTAAFSGGLTAATGAFTGTVSEAGTLLPGTGTATATQGYNSNPLDLQASSFSSSTSKAITQDFRWQVQPTGNDTSTPSGSLNLLFGSNGSAPAATGFSIASNGLVTFATGQTFPGAGGSGTVTSVATGAGLTGGPITSSGTISIPSAGVTNAMLANNSITVTAGSGLSGGGTVALGGTVTLTNTSPSSGGTVTSVASGTGLTGGPITSSGTLSLNTTFTDKRYLQLAGGTLTGALTGTTGAFTGGLAATTGTFTATVSEAGALLPDTGTATATQGFNSNPLDLQASAFSSTTSSAVTEDFRWMVEPTGNDTSTPSGSLNLLFGSSGSTPTATGLSIASNGLITFAPGQTFSGGTGGGSGSVTTVNTGPGLTGGPITTSGTISIPSAGVSNNMLANPSITVTAGSGLSGGGTVALGGTVTLASNLAGTADGIAYFSNPTSIVSTAAPTNGQLLIGSTGNTPQLSTLTAGENINITNSPGSVTISGTGGSAVTLPFFVTGGEHTGGVQAATKNLTKLWGILLPYNLTTTEITYDVTTADNTANINDIGIFNNSGNLVADIGPSAGTTFAPFKAFRTSAWIQGSTSLAAGRYYLAFTTNCASTCAAIAASTTYVSFAINASAGASTGGALPSAITPPADVWGTGNQPTIVIH
jgi:hypothetical protein